MNSLFSINKKTLILVGVLIFIILLTFLLILTPRSEDTNAPTPSPLASPLQTNNLPSLSPNQSITYPDIFKPGSVEQNFKRISNKQSLSEKDQEIKKQLISKKAKSSGVIFENDIFTIEYLPSADYFMSEIKSIKVPEAKKEVNQWFLDQELSQSGICNLPIILYLSVGVKDYLQSNNIQFDPTPEGCQ